MADGIFQAILEIKSPQGRGEREGVSLFIFGICPGLMDCLMSQHPETTLYLATLGPAGALC